MLIYPPHDPRRTDKRLYKGGDGGAADMRAQEEARQRKVQDAVDAINSKFGYKPTTPTNAPTREQFTTRTYTPAPATWGGETWQPTGEPGTMQENFDQAAYDKALAGFQQGGAADANKTARDAMYSDISNAVRDTAMRDLDRQYSQASNKNLFGLARSGLLGGSADAESGGDLSTLYGEGKLKATQAGQQAASDLRSQDEKTRQNLISLAQSGLDTGTAASMAAGQMASAADLAKSQAAGASVGRLFDDMTQAYVTNRVMQARYPNGLPATAQGYSYGGFSPSRYVGTIQR